MMKHKDTTSWRGIRVANGWKLVYRAVPPDLFIEINKLVAKHRGEHFEVWASIPKAAAKD